ncbi:MAG: hypothetical protein JWM44_4177 [Bacilli bacterium]|nr:hypothetical protein [Bacilli bacterium]
MNGGFRLIKSLSRLNRYMTLKQIKKWEKTRKKGKKSYVLNGILLWGFPVSIMGEFLIRITKYGFTLDVFNKDDFFRSISVRIITFIIAGIFFGLYMWGSMERKYQKSFEENNKSIHK